MRNMNIIPSIIEVVAISCGQ